MTLSSKYLLGLLFLIITAYQSFAQESISQEFSSKNRKGSIAVSWGWNWTNYTGSDIHFKGQGHDFTLYDVHASNRQSKFDFNTYFVHFTTPQYNFKVSYFIKDNWNVSFGVDHMKYIMNQNQYATITGTIDADSPYDETYDNTSIQLTPDFLTFEHTDGLNYIFAGINRFDEVFNFEKINIANIAIGLSEGFSTGVYYPKTNSQLLSGERYDAFHVSGYGFDINLGLNITFFNYFFIEGQAKGGYVNMPDIRSTINQSDYAQQDFFYSHYSFMLGANIPIAKKN